MGGQDFSNRVDKRGRTARECFDEATSEARYDNGHGGYTGTIAEKHDFKMVKLPAGLTFADLDYDTEFNGWNPYEDKWGPAGCIDDGDAFVFFGSASS